ncbi:uncharacterized protein [Branchiostoma lanceolatum]|uniref:uncharacterized protein n=1 Tax=Branchiostoma lanceolatum TaxID=7740 RepID=UPI0034513843
MGQQVATHLGLLLLALLSGCTSTDLYVALSGADTPTCGTNPSNSCYSIRHAVSLTRPNDIVYINAMSYTSLNNTDSTFGCSDVGNNFTQATIVLRHSLSIIALDPRVVMDCGAVAPVFLIDGNGTDINVTFHGFVFKNITQSKGTTGTAITARDCRLVITNCAFLGNKVQDRYLAGAIYYHGNHLEISDSIFAGNDGPLLIETGDLDMSIVNCTFVNNTCKSRQVTAGVLKNFDHENVETQNRSDSSVSRSDGMLHFIHRSTEANWIYFTNCEYPSFDIGTLRYIAAIPRVYYSNKKCAWKDWLNGTHPGASNYLCEHLYRTVLYDYR